MNEELSSASMNSILSKNPRPVRVAHCRSGGICSAIGSTTPDMDTSAKLMSGREKCSSDFPISPDIDMIGLQVDDVRGDG